MVAHLYLLAESFSNNGAYSDQIIEDKVKRLAEDVRLINQHKESNILYTNYDDLYPQVFYGTYTIEDFICRPNELKSKGVDRDVIQALQQIIMKSQSTSITSKEVREVLLEMQDCDNCHGLIVFHRLEDLEDSVQLIYGADSWYIFRRFYLGECPKEPDYFVDECLKYFPNLVFHERVKVTISGILKECPKRIIYHLEALNDKFRQINSTSLNRTQVLEQFSILAALDEKASLEGNANSKPKFTFDFLNNENKLEKVCCEPHLKLSRNDNFPGDSSYSTNRRIYFHEGMTNIQDGKILIGHIGEHL